MKLAFVFGWFLVAFPIILRAINAVDNSLAFTFIVIGAATVFIGELNRARAEELSPFN